MALSKVTIIDKIEVLEKGQVQVRTATRVLEDGVELSSSFHRHVLVPCVNIDDNWVDTIINNENTKVQAICNATWTDEIKTAYQEMMDAHDQ